MFAVRSQYLPSLVVPGNFEANQIIVSLVTPIKPYILSYAERLNPLLWNNMPNGK
jgi:hypothetical protein